METVTYTCRRCGLPVADEEAWADEDWQALCADCAAELSPPPCPQCRGWGCIGRYHGPHDVRQSKLEVCQACGG